MLFTYLGAIVGGISLALVLLAVAKLFRLGLPTWIYPASAGIGMILLTVYIEYSWYPRNVEQLPDTLEVVETFEERAPWQPWTYLVPRVDRFTVVDHGSVQRNPDAPDVVLVDVILLQRLSPVFVTTMFIDCAQGRRHIFSEEIELGGDGLPVDGDWTALDADDPLLVLTCTRAGLPAAG